MQLIATAGAVNATAYCTVAEATTLLPLLLHTDLQDAATRLQLQDALIWATQLIEAQVTWYWPPLTDTQALSWPLDGAVDPRGRVLSTATIPTFLKQATAEYALALVRLAGQLPQMPLWGYLRRLTTVEVTMEFRDAVPAQVDAQMPVAVRRLLAPYGVVAGGIAVPLVRV